MPPVVQGRVLLASMMRTVFILPCALARPQLTALRYSLFSTTLLCIASFHVYDPTISVVENAGYGGKRERRGCGRAVAREMLRRIRRVQHGALPRSDELHGIMAHWVCESNLMRGAPVVFRLASKSRGGGGGIHSCLSMVGMSVV